MDKNKIAIIFLILVIISALILLGILIFTEESSTDSNSLFFFPANPEIKTAENLEECGVIQNNGEDNINLIFFSNKDDAQKYTEFLLKTAPFDKNKDKFNVFYIQNYNPTCEIYEEIALLCYNEDIIKKASSCPNDYIVVIKEEAEKIRSSAYMNVMSLNSNHPLTVFPHEWGHVFAFLAEEYVPAKIPKNSKNCVDACEKFLGKEDECSLGCSKAEYFRSINEGVMRTLSSGIFGNFNENLLLERIVKETGLGSPITGQAVQEPVNCKKEKYVLLKGLYSQKEMQIIEKTIEYGCVGKNGIGNFDYKIILEDNSILTQGQFNPELIFTDAPGTETITGEVLESTQNFLLKLPYLDNLKQLNILEDENIIKEVNLDDLDSRLCKR